MVGDDALTAVLGDADADVGVLGVELVQPGPVLLHLAAVPAEVVVVALHVGDLVHGPVGGGHGHVGDGGQAGGIQLVGQLVQLMVVGHQLVGDAADEDLIGNAPEADGGVVVVLDDQLRQLADAVLVGAGVLVEHADEGDLRPDDEAQLVTGVIEVLGVLVVGQADGVGPQLLDDPGVVEVLLPGEGAAHVQPVLVAADAPQRGGRAVDDKALLGVAGELPHARLDAHLVIGLVAALEGGGDGVQVRVVDVPAVGAGDGHRHPGVVRGPDGGGHLTAVGVLDGVHHGEALVGVGHPALQLEPGAAALGAGLGRHLQAGAAVIVQVKVGGGDADQVHAPVQAAVEGEVGGLGIHAVLVGVVAGHHQQVVALLHAQAGDIAAEDGIAPLVIGGLLPVDIHRGLLARGQDFHIHAPAGQGLPGGGKGPGVPAAAPVVAAVAVMAVHRVPGMGQIHASPVLRQGGGKPHVLPDKFPALIQVDDAAHGSSFPPFQAFLPLFDSVIGSFPHPLAK